MQSKASFTLQNKVLNDMKSLNRTYQMPMLVAVSGGNDSMALLHILNSISTMLDRSIVVCHFNHQLRGTESDRDEEYVRSFAIRVGLQYETSTLDVKKFALEHRISEENAARRCRYAFFKSVALKYRTTDVVLAHHADDQMETVLWRLMRGAGTDGLSGMQFIVIRDDIHYIRPLLTVTKQQLVDYCMEKEIIPQFDSSNENEKYTRNAIRKKLVPMIHQFNPNSVRTIGQTAAILSEEDRWMNGLAREWVQKHVEHCDGIKKFTWSRVDFLQSPIALQRRSIKLILNYLSLDLECFSFQRLESIRELIVKPEQPNHTSKLSEQMTIQRSYDRIEAGHFQHTDMTAYEYDWDAETQQVFELPFHGGRFHARRMTQDDVDFPFHQTATDVFVMNLDVYGPIVKIRNRRNGDRIRIHGLNGHKKLKDAWIDAKWPVERRAIWPLLVSTANEILWVPGFRSSEQTVDVMVNAQLLMIRWEDGMNRAETEGPMTK